MLVTSFITEINSLVEMCDCIEDVTSLREVDVVVGMDVSEDINSLFIVVTDVVDDLVVYSVEESV